MIRKIYYKRFSQTHLHHFSPAVGYNTPRIPLGSIGCKGPDYEVVKVVRTQGRCKHLKGQRVLISWGLNLPIAKWHKLKQVIALPLGSTDPPRYGEILLAC